VEQDRKEGCLTLDSKDLLLACLRLPRNELSLFCVVLNDKHDSLEVQSTEVASSKNKAAQVTLAFSEEGMSLPEREAGRPRGFNPNSLLGKVKLATYKLMRAHLGETVTIGDHYLSIAQETGLTLKQVKSNIYQVPGINREYGRWSMTVEQLAMFADSL